MPAGLPGRADHDRRQLRREPELLLGTAPIYNMQRARRRSGAARLRRPDPQRADHHPDQRPQRLRLRPADHGLNAITQTCALSSALDHDLGLPGRQGTRHRTLPSRQTRASPPGCPGSLDRSAAPKRRSRTRRDRAHRSSTTRAICTGQPLPVTVDVRPTRIPTLDHRGIHAIRRRPAAKTRSFDPVLNAG